MDGQVRLKVQTYATANHTYLSKINIINCKGSMMDQVWLMAVYMEIFKRIHHSSYYGEGQYSGADFMIHPNHLYTWDLLQYTKLIEFSSIQMDWIVGSNVKYFFFNIKSLI